MKSVSPALLSFLLSNRQFDRAELYTFTLKNGTVLRITEWDAPLTLAGNTFAPIGEANGQPLVTRGSLSWKVGLSVDSMDLSLIAGTSVRVNGTPILQAIARGDFDGASVLVERLYMPSSGDTSLGTVHLFSGLFSDTTVRRRSADCKIKSGLALLDIQLPTVVVQPGCKNTLFDAGCTLNRASFVEHSSVATGANSNAIACGLTDAAGYFDLGYLKFTSGALAGVQLTVKSYTPGLVVLAKPLPALPAIGDTFDIYPGCDRTKATCSGKFSNLVNFVGMPFVPPPEKAY